MSPPGPLARRPFAERLLGIAARSLDVRDACVELGDAGGTKVVVRLGGGPLTPDMMAFHERVRAEGATVRRDGKETPEGGPAALGTPLIGRTGAAIGVVSVYAPYPRTWSGEDVDCIEDIAWLPESGVEGPGGRAGAAARGEAEERYRMLVESSTDAIALHTNGVLVFANQATARILGAPDVASLVGSPIERFLALPNLPEVDHAKGGEAPLAAGPTGSSPVETQVRRLDGTTVEVEVSTIPLVFRDRPSVQVVLREITDRVRARTALEVDEARFRALVRQLPFIVWTCDREGRIATVIGDPSTPYGSRAAAALYQGTGLPLPRTSRLPRKTSARGRWAPRSPSMGAYMPSAWTFCGTSRANRSGRWGSPSTRRPAAGCTS